MMKIIATLLILSSVLCVKADTGILHKDIRVIGCSDADKEVISGLDGEVVWYADFNKGKGVTSLPKFADPITWTGGYEAAVADQEFCKANLVTIRTAMKNPPVELEAPQSSIYSRDHVELGVDNVLLCHVTGFYPAPVHVTWTRNDRNVTSDVITSTVPYPDGDGTFHQFSSVKFSPEQGDVYSCAVNHQSLTEPLTRLWVVDQGPEIGDQRSESRDQKAWATQIQNQPRMGPAVFCAVGLTLGLLGVATGTYFLIKGNKSNYKKI